VINGDKYRSFHPNYENIITYDLENYVERTQGFVNYCIKRLIDELSNEGYNLIIEGTLRDPQVPINTCKLLVNKGYTAQLFVLAVDAEEAWQSTINRADIMISLSETPRLVPIDKYNRIVNNLPDNLKMIEESNLFSSIRLIDRDNATLYPNSKGEPASEILRKVLNLDRWNAKFEQYADDFVDTKINVLQAQKHKKGR
jgi:UDP-N-acetylglucosamine kinase